MAYTARQIYEAVLIEMNKVDAPSLLLEDFNYLFNKAINQYINKRYNIYDMNQQTTDDLRVLKATALLNPTKVSYGSESGIVTAFNSLQGATYEVELPVDYLHILNCVCIFRVVDTFKCYDSNTYVQFPAKRLTSDAWSQVINNWYGRPSYRNPYYFINNVNPLQATGFSSTTVPTNPYAKHTPKDGGLGTGTDGGITTIQSAWEAYPPYLNTTLKEESYSWGKCFTFSEGNTTYIAIWDNTNQEFGKIVQSDVDTASGIILFNNSAVLYLNSGSVVQVSGATLVINSANKVKGAYTIVNQDFLTNFGSDIIVKAQPKTLNIGDSSTISLVEKPGIVRYGNTSRVRLEVRYGKDDSQFALEGVQVDYLKAPQFIRITQEQLDLTRDTSQMMEFPDYVCQEIINELVHIVMENGGDQRLQTHPIVTQSIANPAQQQAQPQATA